MCLRGMQRDKLVFTLSTAEFSYYTCNILEGSSVSVLRKKAELSLISSDCDWLILPNGSIPLCLTFYPKKEIEADLEILE